MRVPLPHYIHSSRIVIFAIPETIHDSSRYALRAQHNRHRRREIFAVAFLNIEKEIGHGFRAPRLHLQRITEIIFQVLLNGCRFVVTAPKRVPSLLQTVVRCGRRIEAGVEDRRRPSLEYDLIIRTQAFGRR